MAIDSIGNKARAAVMAVIVVAAAFAVSCSKDEYSMRSPKIYMPQEGQYVISPKDTIELTPRILYDDGTRYEWKDGGEVVSTSRDMTFHSSQMRDYDYQFTVWNSSGMDTARVFVRVALGLTMDGMSNCETISDGTLQIYPTSESGQETSFVSKGVTFSNVISKDTTSWNGFAWSSKTAEVQSVGNGAIGTAYVPGSDESNKYLAVSGTEDATVIDFGGNRYTPVSMDFANDNLLYLVAKFGAMTSDSVIINPVGKNDYYRVVVEGIGTNGMPDGSRVSVDLIECSYDNPAKYVRLSEWKTVDLRTIGRVGRLQLRVETNRADYPRLYCIDNLVLQE